VVNNISRVVHPEMKKQKKNTETYMSQPENVETKTINENTNGDEHSRSQNLID